MYIHYFHLAFCKVLNNRNLSSENEDYRQGSENEDYR